MFCAGTGIAPFRGFIQQRAMQAAASPDRKLATAILFVGCRSRNLDRIYAGEFDRWEELGVVDMRYSFSREIDSDANSNAGVELKYATGDPKQKVCRYVQESILRDKEDILRLWDEGARVYVCGSGAFVKEVGRAMREIARERLEGRGESLEGREEEFEELFQKVLVDRCATDIFG